MVASAAVDRNERVRLGVTRWCEQAAGPSELLEGVAKRLRPVLGHEAGAWLVTDPDTVLFTDGYVEGFAEETCHPWFHHELQVPDVATFAELARSREPVAVLSRVADGGVTSSARWRGVLEPSGFGREVRVVFREGATTWGVASVHRSTGAPDFTREDARLLASLSSVVARGLRQLVVRRQVACADLDGPGLLLVGPDRIARAATPTGERWLEALGAPHGALRHPWLHTLGVLATSGTASRRRVRVRAEDGRWVTLHAERMDDPASLFAVIVEPSRPSDIAGLVALAYGLSSRELELVQALARGESTGAMADRLCISVHTVRHHLKSVFDKTGVGSRSELLARLFNDHYSEQFGSRVVTDH